MCKEDEIKKGLEAGNVKAVAKRREREERRKHIDDYLQRNLRVNSDQRWERQ